MGRQVPRDTATVTGPGRVRTPGVRAPRDAGPLAGLDARTLAAVLDPARLAAVHETGLLDTAPDPALDALAQLAARLLGAPLGFVTLVDDSRSFWKACIGIAPDAPRQNTVSESFCQYVLAGEAPLLVEDAVTDPRTRNNPSVVTMGLRAWAGVPVRGPSGQVLGSFCVVDTVARTWEPQHLEVLEVLAGAASAQIALGMAVRREREARTQIDVLAAASALLLEDLDPQAVLRRLTGLAVPGLARWCSAWLPTGDGRLHAVAVAGPPGQQWSWPDTPASSGSLSARAFRSGTPQQVDDLTATLTADQPGSPLTRSSAEAGCGPAYAVPLEVHARVLGAWTLIRHVDDEPFSPADRTFAEQLAGRAAQALSLAQQHAAQREAARVLQESLLPRLPEVEGLAVHAVYRPAGGTQVGGDWFDLIVRADGRRVLVIGDVMGRGVPAAAVMGQVRSAVRAYARMGIPPAQVLDLLRDTVAELTAEGEDSPLVTCFLGVHDPESGTLTWSSAGHPTPVVRGTGSLAGPVGAPLGVPAGDDDETATVLPAGSLLVLFTDGLVEDRRRDLDVGLDLVRSLVDAHDPADLASLAAALLAGVAAEEEDDVALLLVRT